LVQAFPRTPNITKKPAEIVNHAATQFLETLMQMSAYKGIDVKKMPQGIHVQFPKKLFGGQRFEAREAAQLEAVNTTILGSPGLHDGWRAYYLYDKRERLLKIRFTTADEKLESPWRRVGS